MDLVKIGSYIAEKRKKLGMTQKQLAEKLGKSDKSVSKWERGICLPDVSVYLELCEILGISLNEFLAGEDIEVTNVEKKSEDTLIQITKDSSYKQRYLKKIIAVLLIAVGVCVIVFGIMVCNKLRQPQNYIEAVAPDSVEMKTAELLSGIDGTMMFRYNSKDTFQTLYVYLSEYQSGKRISHKKVLELSYEDVKSAKNGLIVITPDFDNFTAKLIDDRNANLGGCCKQRILWQICNVYREQKPDRIRNRARIGSTDLWRTRSEFVADTGY